MTRYFNAVDLLGVVSVITLGYVLVTIGPLP